MARKIVDQLFQNQQTKKDENEFVSLKDWKTLVSRVEHTQNQIEACSERQAAMHSKVMRWLTKVRQKLDTISENQDSLQTYTQKMFQDWEVKITNWIQPNQRKEDQRQMMDLMQRHSQFIQSYNKEIDAVKKSLSKNEYQIYQVLEQMRTVSIELDLINQNRQVKQQGFSTTPKRNQEPVV